MNQSRHIRRYRSGTILSGLLLLLVYSSGTAAHSAPVWGNVYADIVAVIVLADGKVFVQLDDPTQQLVNPHACADWNYSYVLPTVTTDAEKAILSQIQLAYAMGSKAVFLSVDCVAVGSESLNRIDGIGTVEP